VVFIPMLPASRASDRPSPRAAVRASEWHVGAIRAKHGDNCRPRPANRLSPVSTPGELVEGLENHGARRFANLRPTLAFGVEGDPSASLRGVLRRGLLERQDIRMISAWSRRGPRLSHTLRKGRKVQIMRSPRHGALRPCEVCDAVKVCVTEAAARVEAPPASAMDRRAMASTLELSRG